MPVSEIIDRYTISKLKAERTSEDVSEELEAYRVEIKNYGVNLERHVNRLYDINGKIWDTEGHIKGHREHELTLEEVGRLALKVRDLNCERNGIKAEIINEFSEGFKEIKVNYKKVDYGNS